VKARINSPQECERCDKNSASRCDQATYVCVSKTVGYTSTKENKDAR
jgi:hypothetical protein